MEQPASNAAPLLLMAMYRDGEDLEITFYGEDRSGQQASVSRTLSYAAAIGLATQIIQSAGRSFDRPSESVLVLEDLT